MKWTAQDMVYLFKPLIFGRRSAAVNNRHRFDLFNWWRPNSRCVRAVLQRGWQTKAELTSKNRYYVGRGFRLALTDVHSSIDEYQALKWILKRFMTQGDLPALFFFLCRFQAPSQVSQSVREPHQPQERGVQNLPGRGGAALQARRYTSGCHRYVTSTETLAQVISGPLGLHCWSKCISVCPRGLFALRIHSSPLGISL